LKSIVPKSAHFARKKGGGVLFFEQNRHKILTLTKNKYLNYPFLANFDTY
jgi:hypothetical protein